MEGLYIERLVKLELAHNALANEFVALKKKLEEAKPEVPKQE